jgi:hypothetical protein
LLAYIGSTRIRMLSSLFPIVPGRSTPFIIIIFSLVPMALVNYMFDDAIGHWERLLIYGLLNDRDNIIIYDLLLTLIGLRNVQSLVVRQPFYYTHHFGLLIINKNR